MESQPYAPRLRADLLVQEPYLFFVYGTLKRGGDRATLLDETEAYFVGLAEMPGYTLISLGAFPGMIPTPDGQGYVQGELFVGTLLTRMVLDRVEGHPRHYERMLLPCRIGTEAVARESVWAYVYMGEMPEMHGNGWRTGRSWHPVYNVLIP